MASHKDSDEESALGIATPPTASKKARASKATPSKATPNAAGEDGGEVAGNKFSSSELQLLVEMLRTLASNANGAKFDWAAISEKLELPSAGAT